MNFSKLIVGVFVIFGFMLVIDQCEVEAFREQGNLNNYSIIPFGKGIGHIEDVLDSQIEVIGGQTPDGIDLTLKYEQDSHSITRENISGLVTYSLPAVLCPLSDKAVIVIQKSINVNSAMKTLNSKLEDEQKREMRNFFNPTQKVLSGEEILSDEEIIKKLSECDGDTCDYMQILEVAFSLPAEQREIELEFRDGDRIRTSSLTLEPEKILVAYRTDLGEVIDEGLVVDVSYREIAATETFGRLIDIEASDKFPIWLALNNPSDGEFELSIYNSDLVKASSVDPRDVYPVINFSGTGFLTFEDEYVIVNSDQGDTRYWVKYEIRQDGMNYTLHDVGAGMTQLHKIYLPLIN